MAYRGVWQINRSEASRVVLKTSESFLELPSRMCACEEEEEENGKPLDTEAEEISLFASHPTTTGGSVGERGKVLFHLRMLFYR
jgi:hypothetical protein